MLYFIPVNHAAALCDLNGLDLLDFLKSPYGTRSFYCDNKICLQDFERWFHKAMIAKEAKQ